MATVGIALEGGGARGAAHVGVLRALEEEGLKPAAAAGTSAGSIVAAAYALRGSLGDAQTLLSQASGIGTRLLDIDILGMLKGALQLLTGRNFTSQGLLKGKKLLGWLDGFTQGAGFGDTALPLAMPAVDLVSGDITVFASAEPKWKGRYRWNTASPIADAVRASCAIPIVFAPHQIDGALLVDGGVLENLPATLLLAMGVPKVLGVLIDVEEGKEEPPDDIVGIGLRTIHVMQRRLAQFEEDAASALLRVTLPEGSGLFSMEKLAAYEEHGYQAARNNMPKLKAFFK